MGGATWVHAEARAGEAVGDPEEPFPEDLAPLADELIE
jgi:hypothetical protein